MSHRVTQAAVRVQQKVIKIVTQRLHKPQKLNQVQDLLRHKILKRIIKELDLYKTLACMSGRNMRKKYKKPAKFDKKQKVLENLNKNF
jgi:uncharacterized protein YajQ (UPF0234 family)